MARKRNKHEEHENHERWLVSYADFITLLFAFFVVMYSLSALNEGKFRILAEALKAAFQSKPMSYEPVQFNNVVRPEILSTPDFRHIPGITAGKPYSTALVKDPFSSQRRVAGHTEDTAPTRAMREIADKMVQALAPLIEKDLVTVRRFRQWLEVEIKSNILFPSGSAQLQPEAIPVLKRIAGILHEYPNRVQIEGFTDNRSIHTAAFSSNWELSTARSISVVRLLSAEGVSPARLAALGYGEYRPVASNDTEEGRRKNRKVVLVILADDDDAPRLRELMASQGAPEETIARTPPRAAQPSPLPPSTGVLDRLSPDVMSEAAAAPPAENAEGVNKVAPGTAADGPGDGGGTTPGKKEDAGREQRPGAVVEKPSVVIKRHPSARAPETTMPSPVKPPIGAPLANKKPVPPDRVITLPTLPKPGG